MEKKLLDKGFIKYVDHMGSDKRIVDAARVSYQKGTKAVSSDEGLIRYLMRHQHWSPFEQVEFVFMIKMPIFVIVQLLRHRTANINSESGRYSELENECYIPDFDRIQEQSKDNKQGSGKQLSKIEQMKIQTSFIIHQEKAHRQYEDFLKKDVSRELARINLPLSQYMSLYWKCDLRNIFNFLKLRMDSHAQYEIRVLANAMAEMVKAHVPMAYKAFEDYILNSVNLSYQELELIKQVADIDRLQEVLGINKYLSKREKKELLQKFGV